VSGADLVAIATIRTKVRHGADHQKSVKDGTSNVVAAAVATKSHRLGMRDPQNERKSEADGATSPRNDLTRRASLPDVENAAVAAPASE
jgi:hypothetical protein